jgi:hypothetical protein
LVKGDRLPLYCLALTIVVFEASTVDHFTFVFTSNPIHSFYY